MSNDFLLRVFMGIIVAAIFPVVGVIIRDWKYRPRTTQTGHRVADDTSILLDTLSAIGTNILNVHQTRVRILWYLIIVSTVWFSLYLVYIFSVEILGALQSYVGAALIVLGCIGIVLLVTSLLSSFVEYKLKLQYREYKTHYENIKNIDERS